MEKSLEGWLCDSNNLPLPILQYDELAVNLLSRVPTDDVCRVDGIKLHLARFDERTAEHDIEVRLLREVDTVHRLGSADSDRPLPDAG